MTQSLYQLLQERHAGHHHVNNARYGIAIFVVSLLNILSIFLLNFFTNKYGYNRISKKTSFVRLVKKLSALPLALQVALWAAFSVFLTFFPLFPRIGHLTFENWVSLARRFGRIAYALVPFNIFLATKPNPLPKTFYLTLLPLHKWVSRLIVLFATAHAVGYITKWIKESAFHKTLKWNNFLGVTAYALYFFVGIISIRPIRRKFYGFFYLIHTVSAWISLFLIMFHSRLSVNFFTYVSWFLLIFATIIRIVYTRRIKFTVKTEPDAGLSLIQFPVSDLVLRHKPSDTTDPDQLGLQFYSPGSHIRVSPPLTDYRAWLFPSHPYTIASISTDDTVSLVLKKTKFQIIGTNEYAVSASFPSVADNFFRDATDIVIVCGGSGISFGLPIYRYFMSKKLGLESQTLSSSEYNVQLIWVIRNKSDLFVLKELGILSPFGEKIVNPEFNNFDIFVTQFEDYNESFKTDPHAHTNNTTFDKFLNATKQKFSKVTGRAGSSAENQYQQLSNNEELRDSDAMSHGRDSQDKYELDNLQSTFAPDPSKVASFNFRNTDNEINNNSGSLNVDFEIRLSNDEDDEDNLDTNNGNGAHASQKAALQNGKSDAQFIHKGRPDLTECFENLLATDFSADFGAEKSKWIVGCGPEGLIQDCKDWAKKNDVGVISEVYAM